VGRGEGGEDGGTRDITRGRESVKGEEGKWGEKLWDRGDRVGEGQGGGGGRL